MVHARCKLIVAGISTLLLLALAVSTASANRLSTSHTGLWRTVFRPLKFVTGGVTALTCEVTAEGSFHSATFVKVERLLIGHITRASLGPCSTGSATILTETLPWHVQYLGFIGRLPAISGVRFIVIGLSFRMHEAIFGRECLVRSSETEPVGMIAELEAMEAGGNISVRSMRSDETKSIECVPNVGRANYEGTGTITETATGTRLLVKLI